MHKLYTLFFILILTVSKSVGQCLITCNQNVGVFSNNDPNTIGYDNMTSSFHSSIASEELGFRVWGERMLNNGTANALSPIYINSTNYPALTGTIYFAGVGSNSINNVQMIVLTSTGLFASGNPGAVLSTTIKNTAPFQKVTVNGKTDGLPAGITPDSVKMMFVSFQTIILTTCGGRVFVLSQQTNVRGDIGNATQWSPVKMTNGQPLTGIIASRGNSRFAFALKNDNTLWTWGDQIRMGNGSVPANSNFAIQMTPPTGVSRIKMIQGTSSSASNQSYYVLDTTNKVFALGENNNGQLADNTVTDRNVWISCLYSNGSIVNNAKWISSNEHDPLYPNIGIISSTSQMRTAGNNSRWMIGRTTDAGTNNLDFPTGINATDTITFCEVGGHTSAFIKKNTPRYGYVGHHINGSIGNNSAIDNEITSVNFNIPPIISICGTVCDTPIITKKPFNCNDSIATFIIKGRRNNIVRFNLNGVNDSVIIGNNDTAIISRVKPNGDLALNITQINSLYCNLSLAIKDTLKLSTKKDSFASICRNKSIFFNQQVISTSGLYRDTLTNVYGCDSFLNLFITVKDTSKKDSFLTICQPNTIFFNNQTISVSGVYKDTLINSQGCDSILTLNLTVNPKTFGSFSQNICQGSSFLFNGINRSVSGSFIDTLVNSKGCDSILTLNLTVNPKTFGTINQTICQGNSFLFNGIIRTISGAYLDTLVNAKGCDSILTLNLTVNPKTFSTINQTICEGSSFLGRTNSGTYIDTLISGNAKGCDSIRTLVLTVNPKTFGTINQTICEGSSFLFNGVNQSVSGAYLDTLINAKGCDSILTLNLTVNPKTFGSFSQIICQGSSFLFNGINRTVSGTYLDTLVNSKGCDSILTLNLTVNPKTFGSFSQTICQGSSFLFNGINRTISGAYLDTLVNAKGCDSILTLNLTVNPKTFSTINQTICEGSSFLFNGINRTVSGAYLDTLVNAKGCDSILTLNLTVNPKTFGTINQTICEGSSFLFNGINRTVSGTYLDTLVNSKGCDSILTLNLTVNPKTFGTINQTICQGSSFLFNGINRSVSGSFLDTLVNSKGCDSILTLNLTVNPKTFGSINHTICEGSSFLFNGINRTVSGAYLDTLLNAKGCDSILTLNLTVNSISNSTFYQFICLGDTFMGKTTSGIYIDTIKNGNSKGCDSIRTLNLTVNSTQKPGISIIPNPNCSNKNATISAITPSGSYIYSWTVPSGQSSPGNVSSFTTNIAGIYRLNVKTKTSILCNTDFENNQVISGSNFLITNQNNVPCWKTTASDSMIEVWSNGFSGVPSYSGNQFVELNANMVSTLFQNFIAKSGNQIEISFAHRGRAGTDVMSVEIGKIGGPYTNLGNFSAGNTAWVFNSLIYTIPNTISDTNFTLRFNSVSAAGGATIGNFLDAIDIKIISCKSEDTSVQLVINPISTSIINQTICQGNSFLGRTSSGTYIDTLVNTKGCDSILTLNLTVNPKTFGTINQTICEGSSFLFKGVNRTVSGAYLDTLVNAKGCDSILTLNLTVNPKTFGTTNQTICQGSSVLFNGINRTISGSYLDTLVNAKGCDSILTLNLTVNPKTSSTINQTICEGSSLLGRTTSGTYIDTLIGANAKGCDSIRTLVLTVNPKTFGSFSQTICEGSSVLFNGIIRTISGSYLDTLVNVKGCDSILTLNLTVNPKTFGSFSQTICESSSISFNGINRTISGAYLDTLVNAKGCDSILTLNLTVNPKTFGSFSQTICEGSSISFNGINRTLSGSYLDTLVNAKGCDSILTLNLTVNPKTFGTTNQTICEGTSVLFNGINRTISGAYLDTLVNAKGCDSILTLNLTVNPKTFSTINQTICEGSSFLGRTTSGTYIDILIGANTKGCDSIRTLVLTVNPKTFGTINQTICQGSSVLFNGIIRTISGSYLDTLVNVKGCDSILTLNLTVNPKTFGSFSQTICESSSISFNGINRTISGAYLDTLVNAKGCDSILTLNLTVNPKTFGSFSQTICEGSSISFNGINRTLSGSYLDTLVNAKGCDSILTLNLTVNPKTFGTTNQTICEGTSVLFNGINRTISGAYLDTLVNAKGCDSILTLNLTVNPKTSSTINQTICEGSSFLGRTTSGTYIDILIGTNSKGCDSIRTLVLTVNPKTFGTINQTICQGSSVLFNGIIRTISGSYLDTLVNVKGCDSILTLNLTVNPKTSSTINQTICEGSSFLGRTISGTYIDTLIGTNSKGCDSIRTLVLTVNPKTFGTINQTICQGSSVLFNGIIRTISGSYLDTLVNVKGCDSILTLNLTVNPKTSSIINQTICEGSSFLGRTTSGTYIDTLIGANAKGCDSIRTLILTVNPKTSSNINQTICEGSSFLGRTISGTYIDTLIGTNSKGCDSIRTLILTVNSKTFSNFKQTICQGDSFFSRTQTGIYHDTFVNAKGCDSIRTLSLIVNPISRTIINKTICEGDVFLSKSSTGIHLDTFKNQFGCDSVREINLLVLSPIRNNLNYEICQGESFRGQTKTSIFIDTIKNGLGCDSIIETVDLYVRPNIDSSFKIKICEGRSYRGKSAAGNYIDSFMNEYGCISIYRYELSLNQKTYGNETKTICHDQKYKGHTKSGIYRDTLTNQYGCDSIITLTLFVKSNFITKKLQDTTIKKGDTALLQAQKGFLYYTWNTSSTSAEIMVSIEGKYKVTIMNNDGCVGYDSCNVYIIPRDTSGTDTTVIDSIDGYAECPNVFTPNDDFKNDLFRPNFYGNVDVIRLLVYTRFGEKMYEGHGNFAAWDGIYKGEKCEPGVYVYFIEYKNNKGKHFAKGSVTLLR